PPRRPGKAPIVEVPVAEPSILHWLKSDLPSLEDIKQFSLLKQYKTGSPSSILKDLDKPVDHGSTYTAGTHEGVHNNDYNTDHELKLLLQGCSCLYYNASRDRACLTS